MLQKVHWSNLYSLDPQTEVIKQLTTSMRPPLGYKTLIVIMGWSAISTFVSREYGRNNEVVV